MDMKLLKKNVYGSTLASLLAQTVAAHTVKPVYSNRTQGQGKHKKWPLLKGLDLDLNMALINNR